MRPSTRWVWQAAGAPAALAALTTLPSRLAALAIGAVLGRSSPGPSFRSAFAARLLGDAYTTVFRGVPELLIIYLFYFGGSALSSAIGDLLGFGGFVGLPPFLAGALGVGVISGAYQAEVYRGAFLAVAHGRDRGGAGGRHAAIAALPPHHRAAGACASPCPGLAMSGSSA